MFTAFLDACVMVPVSLCDTLLRTAEHDLYRPTWSPTVLEEARRAILEIHPDLGPARIDTRLHFMNVAFPDATVTGYEPLEEGLALPDPNDRHVAAAALRAHADVLVTANLSDFPPQAMDPLGIEVLSPDEFLLDLLDLDLDTVRQVLIEQAAAMARPPATPTDVLIALARAGAPSFAHHARTLLNHS